jgi:gamma-glutamyltranspeptidase/glutathione hydrolase
MQKNDRLRQFRQFMPLALAIALAGCGGGGGSSSEATPEEPIPEEPALIVDTNEDSCSVVAGSGDPIVVGSGVPGDPSLPEPTSGYRLGYKAKHSSKYMVVANTPLASKAGCEVLKAGGSAVDAAVAVQAVLGLVEPQSSTIAGSAFLLHYDAKAKKVQAFDGRETAPAAATRYYLIRQDQEDSDSGTPVPNARRSGRSIGVPGVLRMLDMAHKQHGKLQWNQLFDSGIDLAENGFKIPTRMADAIRASANSFAYDGNAMRTFYHADGSPKESGEITTNPEYAETLKEIAKNGADVLYTGRIAEDIVRKVGQSVGDGSVQSPITPGLMTLDDLKNYQAKEREVPCTIYRAHYICSMSPPSSGGIAIVQTLGMLEHFDLSPYPPTNPENEGGIPHATGLHLIAEAERLAFADRNYYVADTDFVPLPGSGIATMVDRDYLAQRASLIDLNGTMATALPGDLDDLPRATSSAEEYGTTHFSIVDAYGNVVAMTTTVESSMGSYHMVDGFLLSNQLTDFDANPVDAQGKAVANRVSPGKRPRSSMSPTLVFKGSGPDEFVMATGSPGGSAIIMYVLKTVIGALDWGLDAQQATSLIDFGVAGTGRTPTVDASNSVANGGTLDLSGLVSDLVALGHANTSGACEGSICPSPQSSGISTIMKVSKDGQTLLEGGVDPRREGLILGDGAL